MLTGVPIQRAPSSNKFLSNTMRIYTYTFVTTSQKCPKTSYRKSTLPKSAKNQSCRDALPPKNTAPKTNETSNNAHQKACTDYTHHSAMHLPRSYHPYIFPTTPTQSVPHPYSTAHPILLNTHHRPQSSPSTTTTHLNPTSLSTIISYILHKTQYPTLQPTQTITATLLKSLYKHQMTLTIVQYACTQSTLTATFHNRQRTH